MAPELTPSLSETGAWLVGEGGTQPDQGTVCIFQTQIWENGKKVATEGDRERLCCSCEG